MDYEKIVHAIIDPIVTDSSKVVVKINQVKQENKEDTNIIVDITADNDNISRLIGRHGAIANAIRETINIAGKDEGHYVRVHFNAADNKSNTSNNTPSAQ